MISIASRCFYCFLLLLNNSLSSWKYFPFQYIYSIDILPGPVSNRLIHIAINNNSSSYPPTKPFDILTRREIPIISITKRAAVILVTTPTSRNIPPITSNRPIGSVSLGGRPILPKNLESQRIFQTLIIHER